MASKSKSKELVPERKEVAGFIQSATADYYRNEVKRIDKELDLVAGHNYPVDPISSGCLMIDHTLSGGFYPVFNQTSGPEGAGKSTLLLQTLANAYRGSVPMIEVDDVEGTMSPDYAAAMFSSFDLSEVFEEGSRARYYGSNILEDATRKVVELIKIMPDKIWLPDLNSWGYSIKKGGNKRAQALVKAIEHSGLQVDKGLSSDKRWIYPTEYAGAEAFIALDSWAALIPRTVDEDGPSNQMAGNATPLGRELKLFGGNIQRKSICFFTTNQIRENPGARFQDPLYEPGGNALKHFTACRNRMFARAVPSGEGFTKDPKNGSLCIEESIHGDGVDTYAFKQFINTKHKHGRPFLKCRLRIIVADADGVARGIDPFFDTWEYLNVTGQIIGNKKKFKFNFRPSIKNKATLAISDLEWSYPLLKELVMGEHYNIRPVLQGLSEYLGKKGAPAFTKMPKLRESLFNQISTDPDLWSTKSVSANVEDIEEDATEDEDA